MPTRLYAQEGEQLGRLATGVQRTILRAAVCCCDDGVRKRHRILTQCAFRDAGGYQEHGQQRHVDSIHAFLQSVKFHFESPERGYFFRTEMVAQKYVARYRRGRPTVFTSTWPGTGQHSNPWGPIREGPAVF